MNRWLLILPLAAALAACPPSIDTGADGGGVITVGEEGGIFLREGAVIEIPKGALSTKSQITVTVIDSGIPEVPQRRRVSFGYRFSPSGLTFAQPVKITLPYLIDRVPAGVDHGTLDMRRQAGNDAYLQLPGAQTITELLGQPVSLVEAKTERLGLFWLTSPSQPSVSKLEIDPPVAAIMVGNTLQYTAKVTDASGNDVPVAISWSVIPSRVATIDNTGLLTATGPGPATVSARAVNLEATATVYVAGDTKGPQSFVHDNPFPTGNDLWGAAMVGGTAFFVGENATVLSRTASDAWTRHFSGPAVTLRAVAGTSLVDLAAVGTSGTSGVLVELLGGQPKITTFQSVTPTAIWFDGTHGMAVGQGNDVLIRRDGKWVREYSPSFEELLSVVGDGAGGFTTLGNRGSIYTYDPVTKTWDSLFQTQLSALLSAGLLLDVAANEAWAAGANKLWRFYGGAWTAINLPPVPELDEVTAVGLADGKVILAGRDGKSGHLLVADPSALSTGGAVTFWSRALRGQQIIRGIQGTGAEAYAVGDFGAVWRYSGGTFTEVSHGFYGDVVDVAVADQVVVAATNECTTVECFSRTGKVMVRNGPFDWALLGGSQPFTGPIYSVAAKSPTEILVGGFGQIHRFDGAVWSEVSISGALMSPYTDIQFCGDSVYAVNAGGIVLRGSSTALASLPSPGPDALTAIHCASADEVFIAGDTVLHELAGSSFLPRNSSTVRHGSWRAVWTPGFGEAFAFGDARYGVYWNGVELSAIDTPAGIVPDVLAGLWGSSVDNLYAVGSTVTPMVFGYAIRFDGVNWQLVDAGSQRRLTAIHGRSATEIWLGSEGGGVLRALPPP